VGSTPRLRLARAVVASASLTDHAYRFTIGGGANLLTAFYRPDVLRGLEEVSRSVNSGRFADVERLLELLLVEPSLEAEVSLRLAQLRLIRRDWAATTRWLDRAERATSSDIERATIDYFRGWIAERTGNDEGALERYRAAHARFQQSPNLNTLLAAQLMRVGRRSEAAKVLEAFMLQPFDHGRRDLWRILVDGDAGYVREYARRMREAR
jgi:tetratricopeptide (TPR) repeat protein